MVKLIVIPRDGIDYEAQHVGTNNRSRDMWAQEKNLRPGMRKPGLCTQNKPLFMIILCYIDPRP